jgi:hypothetical protein
MAPSRALQCDVCSNIFTTSGPHTPLSLPCGHGICLLCCENFHQNGNSTITCPTCHLNSNYPASKNYPLIVLLDLPEHRFSEEKVIDNLCGCKKAPISYFCFECEESFCEDCNSVLHRAKRSTHRRTPTKTHRASNPIVSMSCPDHQGRSMEFFCKSETCRKGICSHCVVGSHRTHDISLMSEVSADLKRILSASLEEAAHRGRVCEEALISLEKAFASLGGGNRPRKRPRNWYHQSPPTNESGVDIAKRAIKSHCAALRSAVDELESRLLSEVDEIAAERAAAVQAHMKSLQQNLLHLQRCSDGVRSLDGRRDFEVCASYPPLLSDLTALKSSWTPTDTLDDGVIPVCVKDVCCLVEIQSSIVVGGPAACARVEVIPDQWAVDFSNVDKAVSYKIDLYTDSVSLSASSSSGERESCLSASWTCVPTPSSPSTRTSLCRGDRLALGNQYVYARVCAVNLAGLSSVSTRSPTVKLLPPFRSFCYVSDFDENGVLYYIGTGGGTHPYRNPHESGDVVCIWSSIENGPVSHFVSRESQYSYTHDLAGSWMMLDLGEGRRLTPTHYTLRHGFANASFCLRHWRLEGRVCGGVPHEGTWVPLSAHNNDTSLNAAYATATWAVEGIVESYRCFRLIVTGVDSGCNYLMCSGVELYGDLMEGVCVKGALMNADSNSVQESKKQ